MVSPRLATASRQLLITRLLRPTATTHSVILASSSSTSSTPRPYSSGFQPGPSPPRLPPEQQAEFERLQRAVAERFVSTPSSSSATSGEPAPTSPSPASTSRHISSPTGEAATTTATTTAAQQTSSIDNKDDDELSAGGVWRGAKPEFEGDVNPKTGEVGGPKNEPLRWGSAGDWSYNGRVTDF